MVDLIPQAKEFLLQSSSPDWGRIKLPSAISAALRWKLVMDLSRNRFYRS